jgi:two-component system cell cycle sensor histidine kinase/response regulator CckA
MKHELRILHLEDSDFDAELIQATLLSDGLRAEIQRAQTRDEFERSIDDGGMDLILADCSLPSFDGMTALQIAKERCSEVPFIFVSGSLGEEVAIDTLKSGATDYVLKHRLSRLAPAVKRALSEAEARTERRKLEAQLIHAQKMESVGTLAGGVAHDFNNLLTAIVGNAQLALSRISADNPAREALAEIEKSGVRAADLTRQLLIFSRKQRLEPKLISLNEIIRNFMKMLKRIIGEDVDVEFREGQELPPVLADPGQIEQVVMNLAVNARDAMAGGGKLTISTEETFLTDTDCQSNGIFRPGRFARISVSDTGSGMDEDTLSRIFEPFFTTKGEGRGTGLGLSVVYGIVKQHDGLIDVTSSEGEGSTFSIYLPISREAVRQELPAQDKDLKGGKETILVAEDEELLRRLAREILEGLGYCVILASDGEEAVTVYRENRDKIDLMLLDIVMPKIGGRAAYECMRAVGCEVPVIFMTGYSAELAQNKFLKEINGGFIPKPYSVQSLGQKVREVLDASIDRRPAALLS